MPSRTEDRELAAILHRCTVRIMAQRILERLCIGFCLPMRFAQLVHDRAEEVTECLAACKKWFEVLEKLETAAHTEKFIADLLDGLLWPRVHFCRMILVALAESDWQSVPHWVREKVCNMLRGFTTTKVVEDLIRVLRKAEKENNDNHDVCRLKR